MTASELCHGDLRGHSPQLPVPVQIHLWGGKIGGVGTIQVVLFAQYLADREMWQTAGITPA